MEGRFVPDDRHRFCKIFPRALSTKPLFLKRLSKEASKQIDLTLYGHSDKNWIVKPFKDDDNVYLGEGWLRFVRDNSLGNDEFLVFVYDGVTGFEVQIFEKNTLERINDAIDQKLGSTGKKRKDRRTRINEEEEEMEQTGFSEKPSKKKDKTESTDFPAPVPFTSNYPYFWMQMGVNNVERVFVLQLPSSFSQAYLTGWKTEIVLQNAEGKTWKVKCYYRSSRSVLCGGWIAFSRDNKLKTGDICIFELVDTNKMQVHIFPT